MFKWIIILFSERCLLAEVGNIPDPFFKAKLKDSLSADDEADISPGRSPINLGVFKHLCV